MTLDYGKPIIQYLTFMLEIMLVIHFKYFLEYCDDDCQKRFGKNHSYYYANSGFALYQVI